MDDDGLTRGMRGLVRRCVAEAVRRGSATVEAEHVLLALTADPAGDLGVVLLEAGLPHGALVAALRQERLLSLATAGVTPIDAQDLTATPRTRKPTWGASVVAARARAHRSPTHGLRRRLPEIDVLVGILRADIGTVPRALAIVGVDRPALVARLDQMQARTSNTG
jgi:hypothetical protein